MQCSRLFYPSAWLPRRAMHCGQKVTRLFDIENIRIRYNQSNIGGHWSPDMSAPQHIGVRAPTGRLSGVREQTCRLPSKLSLGSRQAGCLAFGSRPVGSPAYRRWGTDRSVPQKIAVGGPTCRLPHRVKQSAVYRHLMTPSWAILLITSHVPNA